VTTVPLESLRQAFNLLTGQTALPAETWTDDMTGRSRVVVRVEEDGGFGSGLTERAALECLIRMVVAK